MRRKNPINKATKVHLVFDESERRDFILGFHKRKEARKLKAKQELERRMKEEKKKIKLGQKDMMSKLLLSQRTVPEVEHLVDPVIYELPEHTVTITSIDNLQKLRYGELDFKENHEMNKVCNIEDNTPSEEDPLLNNSEKSTELKRTLREHHSEAIKGSQVFSAVRKLQQKKDKKKAKQERLRFKRQMRKSKSNKRHKVGKRHK